MPTLTTIIQHSFGSPSYGNMEKEMATHSSIPAWRILWTDEPGGLQSTGLQKSRTWLDNWTTSVYMSIRVSQFLPPSPSPNCVHKFILCVCISIPTLQVAHQDHFSRFHAYAFIYGICFSFSDLFHSVWQTLGSSTSLSLTQFHSFLWLSWFCFFKKISCSTQAGGNSAKTDRRTSLSKAA